MPERPVLDEKLTVKGYEWVGPKIPVPVSVVRSVSAFVLTVKASRFGRRLRLLGT